MSRCALAGVLSTLILTTAVRPSYAQPVSNQPPARVAPPAPSAAMRAGMAPDRILSTATIRHSPEVLPTPPETLQPGPATSGSLSLELLIDDVLARHPSIASAQAAWQAAAARYPQVVSLDDPMLDTMVAPASLGSNAVDFAYVIQGRQKLPWSGKRSLRGQIAVHQTQAAAFDVADARVALVEVTSLAFYEYYLAERRLELNDQTRRVLAELRSNALRRYEAQLVSQQDVLLADVEVAQLERQRVELEQSYRIALARINTLLLRPPVARLPRSPSQLEPSFDLLSSEQLIGQALSQRPDLTAAWKRLRAEQASVALACREFKPDLELVGRYDTFWQRPQQQLQGQVGVTLNVPLAQERRRAAVREASAKVSQQRAEINRLVAQIQFDVQSAYERTFAAQRNLQILRTRVVPAAEASYKTAINTYVTGTLDFLRVVEAQRQLLMIREQAIQAEVEYHSRIAELQRMIAGPIPPTGIPPRATSDTH